MIVAPLGSGVEEDVLAFGSEVVVCVFHLVLEQLFAFFVWFWSS